MRDCRAFRIEIEEASGAMPLGGAAREHAGACPACGDFYRERAGLRRLVGELERVAAPPDFDIRLRARMAAARGEGRRTRAPFFRLSLAPVAAAACLVAIIGSVYFWPGQKGTQTADSRRAGEQQARASRPAVEDESNAVKNVVQPESKQPGAPVNVNTTPPVENPDRREPRAVRVAQRNRPRQSVAGEGRTSAGNSEFSHHAARVIAGPGRLEQSASRNAALMIPVRASSEPLHVVLRDERGATQRVAMSSVSFGSQGMGARGRMTTPASFKSKEGVW